MKIETALLILSFIGTFILWSVIIHYKLKRKILLLILSIPFGWVGLIVGFMLFIDNVLLKERNENN